MAAKRVKAAKVAPTLGDLIDELYRMGVERRAAQKAVDDLRAAEKALETKLLADFDKSALSKAAGKLAIVSVKVAQVPSVVDWTKLYDYITAEGAFELLQRRVSATAWRERREQGIDVPGTESFTVVELSVRKKGSV